MEYGFIANLLLLMLYCPLSDCKTLYNTILSGVDNACTDVADTEKVLRGLSEQMLMDVVTKFGKNSHEYGMAGGARKVDRKRPKRSASKPAAAPSTTTG